MQAFPDPALYERGAATLIASWEAYARGAPGAAVVRAPGVDTAIFPHEPERTVYNNALLARALGPAQRASALDAMAATYARAGVGHFAAWVHETDLAMRADLERRGYLFDSATRAMGMALADLDKRQPEIDVASLPWAEYLRRFGLPSHFLAGADHAAFHIEAARLDGDAVAAALAFDHAGDCGIYNVETLDHARRRGLGTALTRHQLLAARARGRQTASLQATPQAERLYAALGFRDLGRILEYVPGGDDRAGGPQNLTDP